MSVEAELREETVEAPPTRGRVGHIFLPWSCDFERYGYPPPGSVALCGWVRRSSTGGRSTNLDHPDACVVCLDLDGKRSA